MCKKYTNMDLVCMNWSKKEMSIAKAFLTVIDNSNQQNLAQHRSILVD